MTNALWTFEDLLRASEGRAHGSTSAPIIGISIDTRTLAPGELFVALKDQRDGHEFVTTAFERGAAAALVGVDYVAKPGDGALIHVPDTLRGLEAIGVAARARLSPKARVVAVTGSAGKTGTKEMLKACLSRVAPTHAADKSFNNHWGVPLTLARMPRETMFGIFEIGMNHAGEITPLTKMVRPHAAIVTTVEPVHLEHFPSVDAIAAAKAEIFSGLEPQGAAIINADNPYHAVLEEQALAANARIMLFGRAPNAAMRPSRLDVRADGSTIELDIEGKSLRYQVATPGAHIAQNSLAVVAAIAALGADVDDAIQALATLAPPPGRGARTRLKLSDGHALLIDESYNANPASMRAALTVLASVPRDEFPRRIAVLGDMLELGPDAQALHCNLKTAVDAAGVDLVFAAGKEMAHLYETLTPSQKGAWGPTSTAIEAALIAAIRAGDVVMVKGSFGSRMGPIAEAIRTRFVDQATG